MMSRILVALVLLGASVGALALTARAQQDQPAPTCRTERALVKVRPGADPAVVIGRHGGTILDTIAGIGVQVVSVPEGRLTQTIDALSADPDVEYAEPDEAVTIHQPSAGGCP